MEATLVNLDNPGTPGGLSRSRLLVGGKLYKVKATEEGLLAIRRGGQWEYYRSNEKQFGYTKTGSTLKFLRY